MIDLETLANKVQKWRAEHHRGPYPKYIWDEIRQLAEHHPIFVLADILGIRTSYLQQKLTKNAESFTFAPIKATSFPAPVSIEFTDSNCRAMTIHFHADLEQLTHMILSLLGNPA
jgi:hypothetical protein